MMEASMVKGWVCMRVLILGVALIVASSVHGGGSAETELAATGAELLQPFKRDLKQALTSGLEKGVAEAIDVCRVEAPAIADRHGSDAVRMGRTSHKLRNPGNAPPDWVAPLLAEYVDARRDGPTIVELDDGSAGYIEPIVTQPVCLACHGSTVAPEIAAQLEAAYPHDNATGFSVGDLRGLWWVTFPADEGR
jgi:hypothetical protein